MIFIGMRLARGLSSGLGCPWMMGDIFRWETANPFWLQCHNLAGPLFMEQAL